MESLGSHKVKNSIFYLLGNFKKRLKKSQTNIRSYRMKV